VEDASDLTTRWDAELAKRGRLSIVALLDNIGASPNSTFPLYGSGLREPTRAYVEQWLTRQEAESDRAARARHDQSMRRSTIAICLSLLALVIAILALWRKW
jgi:hypothetical protein